MPSPEPRTHLAPKMAASVPVIPASEMNVERRSGIELSSLIPSAQTATESAAATRTNRDLLISRRIEQSIPQRLPCLQRVLNALLRFALAAQRFEALAL